MSKHAVIALKKADKKLAKIITAVGPCTLKANDSLSPFHSLAESIAYQQLTGKAAKTIWTRVLALFRGKYPSPKQLLNTPAETLRAAGLSRSKVLALHDLAQKTIDGIVPTAKAAAKLSDIELVERLTAVRGIGPWTVEMFLIFTLGRTDVMPSSDYGVRNGFAKAFGMDDLPKPKELLAHAERWKPHRTVAAWYLWRAVDLHREKNAKKPKKTTKSGRSS